MTYTPWNPGDEITSDKLNAEHEAGRYGLNVKAMGALGNGTADDTLAIQNTIDAVAAAGGGMVYFPAGTYMVDGFKGKQASFVNGIRGGLQVPGKITLKGESENSVVLKNNANQCTAMISIRGGDAIQILDLTIDLDWPNKTCALPDFSSTRGEGIIYWNGSSTATNHRIGNVTIRNTGHYGIGVQNVAVTGLEIFNYSAYNIGGDALDIKDYVGWPKIGITVTNGYAENPCLNATIAMAEQDAAAWDLRGDVLASNLRVVGLNSYMEADGTTPMIGNNGIRVNGAVDSDSNRRGGRKARVIGGSVKSSKGATEGSEIAKRIIGVRAGDDYASVVGVVVENCYVGFRITQTGDSVPVGVFIDDCQAIGCTGASAGGIGVSLIGATSYGTNISVLTSGCDTGFIASTTGGVAQIGFLNNTVDHTITEDVMRQNNFGFYSYQNVKTSTIARPSKNNYAQDLTVWNDIQPMLRLRSTFDGTWTTPYTDGILSFESADVSGAGAGIRAQVKAQHTGATAGGTNVVIAANDGTTGLVDVLTINASRPSFRLASIPNAANDAAAAALSPAVPVGGIYRNGSILMIRAA